jgi:acyl-CoA synthetase (AMP-forming)/AMP-acid ligase II
MAETPFDHLVRAAGRWPDSPAIIASGEAVTYTQLRDRGAALAARMAARGIETGQRVCIGGESKLGFITGILAGFARGAVVVPLPAGDAALEAQIVADCAPRIVARGGDCLIDADMAARPADPGLAMLLYSSGTTAGERKAARITHDVLCATVAYINDVMSFSSEAVEYAAGPIHHAFGLGRARAVLAVGGTLVVDDGAFNPARMLLDIERLGCNALSAVSSVFTLLFRTFPDQFEQYGRGLRWMEIGSLPMPAADKRQLLDMLPQAHPFMNYGLTEAMRSTFLDLRAAPGKLASVGRASPGVAVATLDEAGAPLGPDEEGEIAVRGANLADGYWGRSDLWHSRMSDGWFRTGDLGRIDAGGYVYYTGRLDDVINIGGFMISPSAVEEALDGLLAGRAYCVVGAGDAVRGAVPVLCIEGEASGPALAAVTSHLHGALPDHMIPKDVRHFPALPRTANGKIIRRIVQRWVE